MQFKFIEIEEVLQPAIAVHKAGSKACAQSPYLG